MTRDGAARVAVRRRRRRGFEDGWLLLLSAEKSLQHAFVTWAFATDRFNMRDQVAAPYEILLVIGGISAALFASAVVGVWRRRRWAPPLLLVLALMDIVGEFVAQGTLMPQIMVSFIVACALFVLAWRARRRYEASAVDAARP